MSYELRRATREDLAKILQLYSEAYSGTYPDPTFTSVKKLLQAIESYERMIYVATVDENVVASILFMFDKENKLGKAGGAVVHPEHRGQQLTQLLINYGTEDLHHSSEGLDVLYVTTRTVHKAAQILTQKIGFMQLGIFPNVHKTEEYETHALAAMFFNDKLKIRYTNFEQHPKILPLFDVVRENCPLPMMNEAKDWNKKDYPGVVPTLEVIEAPAFVKKRMELLVSQNQVDLAFFPFHTPSILITSPNQKIEVFAYVNEVDKHCVITGCNIDKEVSFSDLFLKVSNILRDRGIRYIEVIIRANRLNIVDKVLKARFIPCGYVPAFQLEGEKRYDYVVFSRSFEILDFKNLELTGENEKYLRNYISLWEETFLGEEFSQKGNKSE